jgi:hypothetical protein
MLFWNNREISPREVGDNGQVQEATEVWKQQKCRSNRMIVDKQGKLCELS